MNKTTKLERRKKIEKIWVRGWGSGGADLKLEHFYFFVLCCFVPCDQIEVNNKIRKKKKLKFFSSFPTTPLPNSN